MIKRRDFIKQTAAVIALGALAPVEVFAARRKKAATVKSDKPAELPLQPADVTKLPAGVQHLDLFLLMGQSNMKGRGEVPPDQKINPHHCCPV
jgi:hypothetical protein